MPTMKYPPETVEDAIEYLETHLSLNDSFTMTSTRKEDLDDLYYSVGAFARDVLGLWSGNDVLLESCRMVSGNQTFDADDASMLIIGLLWDRLNNNAERITEPAGAEQLNDREIVSHEEVLMSQVIQSMALINLLDSKGIVSKNELLEEIVRLKKSTLKADR